MVFYSKIYLIRFRNAQLSHSQMTLNAYDTVSFEFTPKTAEVTNFHRLEAEVEVRLELNPSKERRHF